MANKKFQVPINLLNLASNPASASEGDIYYNTLDDTIRLYANGSWVNVGAAGPSGVINVTSPITNSGTSTSAQLGFDQTAQNTTNDARYARLSGATFTGAISGTSLTLSGDLTINGTTTTINSTTLTVDDKNIELGSIASPTNTTADGGGITLKGTTDKTFNWVNSTSSWTSSEHITLASNKNLYGGSSVSVFTTTDALTIGKNSYLSTGTITNNILSGGNIQGNSSTLEVIDNYSVRSVYAPSGDTTQTINIGTGTVIAIPESSVCQYINIGTGSITSGNKYISIGTPEAYTNIYGDFYVSGWRTTIDSPVVTIADNNIELGSVSGKGNTSGTITASFSGSTTGQMAVTTTTGLIPGMVLTKVSGTGAFGGTTTITQINNTTSFSFTSATAITAGAIVFTVGGATNLTADGGGITIKGTPYNKEFKWVNATSAWTSSEHISLASGKNLLLNGSTSGTITLTPAATAGTNTITLPAATGTVALLDSPAFTGTPTAPTASANTSTTQIATTAYVVEHSETLVAKLTATTGAIANTQTQVVAFTAPANSIVAGDVFRFTGYANASGGTTASPILRIRIGTTTLTGAIVSELTGTTTTSTTPFKFEAIVTCRTAGSSGTVGGASSVIFATGSSTQSITSAVTVNTTVSNIVEATFQSGGTRTYTFEHAILEKLPS